MDIAETVADILAKHPKLKEIGIDTSDLGPAETMALAKQIIDACKSAPLKGVRVDPFVGAALPIDRDYVNAATHQGAVIVLDPRLQDRIEVVRR